MAQPTTAQLNEALDAFVKQESVPFKMRKPMMITYFNYKVGANYFKYSQEILDLAAKFAVFVEYRNGQKMAQPTRVI